MKSVTTLLFLQKLINYCPDLQDITYVKDTSNRLNQFVGTWKGVYNDKNYEIKFEKKIQFGNDQIKWDKIIGRMLVKNNQGNIIYSNLSESDEDVSFWGVNFQGSAYEMAFIGNYDCTESGKVIIEKKFNSSNEITLFYFDDTDVTLNPVKCPNYSTFVPLLPMQKMTLVKQ